MNKPLIIANWKCNNTTFTEAKKLFLAVSKGANKTKAEVAICPPFIFIPGLSSIAKSPIKLGAQDAFSQQGAFTGQISIDMLKQFGCKYAIIGHSEKRALGETNGIINKKIKACLENNLIPVFCIGENEQERRLGKTSKILKSQLKEGLKGISSFNIGGKLGNAVFSLLQYAFGWGAYLLAISLAVIGILIIKSISSLACTTTIASVCAMFLSLLGIIQMIFGYSSAAETPTGGKLGQIIGASLENMFGFQGGIILIFAFFIASILIALNISLITIWETIPKKKSASDISPDAQALNSGNKKLPLESSSGESAPPASG